MAHLVLDFSRPFSKKLVASVSRRLSRLEAMRDSKAVEQATAAFGKVAPGRSHLGDTLRIRHGFAFATDPAPGDSSDRRAPEREHRPPATRIVTSRGLALRLELMALAVTQARFRAGAGFRNERPLRPDTATSGDGWIDLFATPTRRAGSGRTSSGVLDKKLRQLQTALNTLSDAGLVDLPHADATAGAYEGFELLDERGPRTTGPPLPYEVPRATESVLTLPSTLITSGWIHVLEDSELAVLLMVACGIGRLPNQGSKIAIPADVRLLHYGISRHPFADAHVVLNRLGLLDVDEVGRDVDGRALDFETEGASLHRLEILPDGFSAEALPTALERLRAELRRVV